MTPITRVEAEAIARDIAAHFGPSGTLDVHFILRYLADHPGAYREDVIRALDSDRTRRVN